MVKACLPKAMEIEPVVVMLPIEALATHVDVSVRDAAAPAQPELRRVSRVATRRPASAGDIAAIQATPLPDLRRDTAAKDLA